MAMKHNPDLKVMLNGGYYDVATPYFAGQVRDAPPADPREPAEATSSIITTSPATWCTRTTRP